MSDSVNERSKSQIELFNRRADLSYFRIYSSMIASGDVAAMGIAAFGLYCVIRSYANWQTGRAIPSIQTLEKATGMTRPTITKHLEKLAGMDYLEIQREEGTFNRYYTKDKIAIDADADAQLLVSKHIPRIFDQARTQMKQYVERGQSPTTSQPLFIIQNLNVTINNVSDNQNVTLNNVPVPPDDKQSMTAEDIAEALAKLKTISRQAQKAPRKKFTPS